MKENKKDYIPFTKQEQRLIAAIEKKRMSAESRYPLLVGLLATFGFVSVLYGFEKIIDNIEFLVNNPLILLLTGLLTLGLTGAAYKKLN